MGLLYLKTCSFYIIIYIFLYAIHVSVGCATQMLHANDTGQKPLVSLFDIVLLKSYLESKTGKGSLNSCCVRKKEQSDLLRQQGCSFGSVEHNESRASEYLFCP